MGIWERGVSVLNVEIERKEECRLERGGGGRVLEKRSSEIFSGVCKVREF